MLKSLYRFAKEGENPNAGRVEMFREFADCADKAQKTILKLAGLYAVAKCFLEENEIPNRLEDFPEEMGIASIVYDLQEMAQVLIEESEILS